MTQDYQFRETGQGVEILRMRPEVVAQFTDRALAEAFMDFLAGRDGGETSDRVDQPHTVQCQVQGDVVEPSGAGVAGGAVDAGPEPVATSSSKPEADPGDWTEAELAGAFTRLTKGEKVKDVADHFGKKWTTLRSKWAREKSERREASLGSAATPAARSKSEPKPKRVAATPAPAPVPTAAPVAKPAPKSKPMPKSKPEPAPDQGFAIDLDKAKSGAEKLQRMHLRAVGYAAPWTPELDLRLVEGLARGDGLGIVAAEFKMSLEDCRTRWNALLPEKSIDGQKALLEALRALVAEKANAAT